MNKVGQLVRMTYYNMREINAAVGRDLFVPEPVPGSSLLAQIKGMAIDIELFNMLGKAKRQASSPVREYVDMGAIHGR